MLQHVGVTPHKATVRKVCQPGRMLPRDHSHPIYQHPLGARRPPNTQTYSTLDTLISNILQIHDKNRFNFQIHLYKVHQEAENKVLSF